ncbi:MAG TPA: hypothetical protein VNW90_03560 [Acetobacteraceae bacterium]|nr:hypothetical protein [Acetobacteraceae bacterium]
MNLFEYHALVGAEVDHPVADDNVRPTIVNGQFFRQSLAERDIRQTKRSCSGSRLCKHLIRHIDTDHVAAWPYMTRRNEGVEAA